MALGAKKQESISNVVSILKNKNQDAANDDNIQESSSSSSISTSGSLFSDKKIVESITTLGDVITKEGEKTRLILKKGFKLDEFGYLKENLNKGDGDKEGGGFGKLGKMLMGAAGAAAAWLLGPTLLKAIKGPVKLLGKTLWKTTKAAGRALWKMTGPVRRSAMSAASKVGSSMAGIGRSARRLAKPAMRVAARVGLGAAKAAAKLNPITAGVVLAAEGLYAAFDTKKIEEVYGEASFKNRFNSFVDGALSGLTFGIVSKETIGEAHRKFNEWTEDLRDTGADWLANTFPSVYNGFNDAVDAVVNWFSGLGDQLTQAWNDMVAWFSGKWDEFVNSISEAWSSIKVWFNEKIVKPIKGTFNKIGNWFSNLWENQILPKIQPLLDFFSTIGDWFGKLWSDTIQPVVGPIIDSITGIFRAIGDGLSDAWNWLASKLSWLLDTDPKELERAKATRAAAAAERQETRDREAAGRALAAERKAAEEAAEGSGEGEIASATPGSSIPGSGIQEEELFSDDENEYNEFLREMDSDGPHSQLTQTPVSGADFSNNRGIPALEEKAKRNGLSQAHLDYMYETDRLIGAPRGVTLAQLNQESDLGTNLKSGTGAVGLAQFTSIAVAQVLQNKGIKDENGRPPGEHSKITQDTKAQLATNHMMSLEFHRNLMMHYHKLRAYGGGSWQDTVTAYNGGGRVGGKYSGNEAKQKEIAEYLPRIMAHYSGSGSGRDFNPETMMAVAGSSHSAHGGVPVMGTDGVPSAPGESATPSIFQGTGLESALAAMTSGDVSGTSGGISEMGLDSIMSLATMMASQDIVDEGDGLGGVESGLSSVEDSGMLSLDDIPMVPTDTNLMALNTGLV